jgi:hypothetical protein
MPRLRLRSRVLAGHPHCIALVQPVPDRAAFAGQARDPLGRLVGAGTGGQVKSLSFLIGHSWLFGSERLEPLSGVTAAEFRVGRRGQVPGLLGRLLPFPPGLHCLLQLGFLGAVEALHGGAGAGQYAMPAGAFLLAALTGNAFLDHGPDRGQVRVIRADPGPLQLAADVPGAPGGLRGQRRDTNPSSNSVHQLVCEISTQPREITSALVASITCRPV